MINENYIPSQQCFDWALDQHVTHSNNLEIGVVFFVFLAYVCINMYHTLKDTKYDSKALIFIYLAKMAMLIFFGAYILIIKLRLIY